MPYNSLINFRFVARHIGKLLLMEAALMFIPFILSLFYQGKDAFSFAYAVAICIFVGGSLLLFIKRDKSHIGRQEGFLLVGLTWLVFSIFGSIPFYIAQPSGGITNALFETISGFTTTGATIMPDVEALSKPILFWRAFIQWIGGVGIIVFTIALVSTTKQMGSVMYAVEFTGPGAEKEHLHPKIKVTVRRILFVYALLTISQTFVLGFLGLSWFDSLCYAFSTISTGGFALNNHNLADFSHSIQYAFMFFMFLSGINYILFFYILTGKFFKAWRKDEQYRWYVRFIIIIGVILSLLMIFIAHFDKSDAIRYGFFYAVSFLTTTGYAIIEDTSTMPLVILSIFYLLMFVGGCAGSGSGGFKIIRFLLSCKNANFEFNRQMHPRAVFPIHYGGNIVKEEVVRNVLAFFFLFTIVLAGGIFLLSLSGISLEESISLGIASFCNAGPSIGTTCYSCSYIELPMFSKWVLMALMMFGRLEVFTVFILFSRYFWNK